MATKKVAQGSRGRNLRPFWRRRSASIDDGVQNCNLRLETDRGFVAASIWNQMLPEIWLMLPKTPTCCACLASVVADADNVARKRCRGLYLVFKSRAQFFDNMGLQSGASNPRPHSCLPLASIVRGA